MDQGRKYDPAENPVQRLFMVIGLAILSCGLITFIKWLFVRAPSERPVRLFWDVENARCMIPKRASFERCVDYLRQIASLHGVDLQEEYGIKIICGGFDDNIRCSQSMCIHAAKVCDSETLKIWKAGSTLPTRIKGVMIQCGWDGKIVYEKNKADKMILKQLDDVLLSSEKVTVIVVSVDYRLRQRALRAPMNPSKQSVVLHPEFDSQDGVWPVEFYERSARN
ncbi:uncharacterized protein LOC129584384 [Paramacrobiotus metropolitanus]|uniref:uncharacterized protein LOC129584384 n=1 Tax=Paramacrobiotus metropolitanus TaxID=2943436 RepID=UPI002446553F|nr:uncharacterized protein LOC129584384 [Paramacrobiotus metropolitanus]